MGRKLKQIKSSHNEFADEFILSRVLAMYGIRLELTYLECNGSQKHPEKGKAHEGRTLRIDGSHAEHKVQPNEQHVMRARARIETEKWLKIR